MLFPISRTPVSVSPLAMPVGGMVGDSDRNYNLYVSNQPVAFATSSVAFAALSEPHLQYPSRTPVSVSPLAMPVGGMVGDSDSDYNLHATNVISTEIATDTSSMELTTATAGDMTAMALSTPADLCTSIASGPLTINTAGMTITAGVTATAANAGPPAAAMSDATAGLTHTSTAANTMPTSATFALEINSMENTSAAVAAAANDTVMETSAATRSGTRLLVRLLLLPLVRWLLLLLVPLWRLLLQ